LLLLFQSKATRHEKAGKTHHRGIVGAPTNFWGSGAPIITNRRRRPNKLSAQLQLYSVGDAERPAQRSNCP